MSVAFLAPVAFADSTTTNCQPVYGGGQTCNTTALTLNKEVQNPQSGEFVNSLGINDPKFSPGQTATFRLTVTNNGNDRLNNITIKDTLPQFLTFVSGTGSFDSGSKVLTITVDGLNGGESKSFTFQAKAADANTLPADQGITCVVNQATATADNNLSAQDNAQMCIQKQVLSTTKGGLLVFPAPNVTSTPPTGPEAWVLATLVSSFGAGLAFRRRTK